jgi:very-short-patch-repair endonuclease
MSAELTKPRWQVTPKLRSRARTLRRDLTQAERILWSALRAHRLNGASFRRQTPVGPFVADFLCHAAKLIVELDGDNHFDVDQEKRDARRTAFLKSRGFTVIRFTNLDVMKNRVGVLETIVNTLAESPSPTLPRRRGRERTGATSETIR